MIDRGKNNVLGVIVDAVDYESATAKVIEAAKNAASFTVSALAVHGVMTGVLDKVHKYRLNNLDLIVPDGQPVRWNLNLLHKCGLKDRVYGPELMLKICQRAEAESLQIYLYGSQEHVLEKLHANLSAKFPLLKFAGMSASRFRQTTPEEQLEIAKTINSSGADIVFVGLGCPRQEVWIYEYRHLISLPLIAVGAAFDFHAGLLPQAPTYLQKWGLEWLYRLWQEPKRLWKRYLYLNTLYICSCGLQKICPHMFDPKKSDAPGSDLLYG